MFTSISQSAYSRLVLTREVIAQKMSYGGRSYSDDVDDSFMYGKKSISIMSPANIVFCLFASFICAALIFHPDIPVYYSNIHFPRFVVFWEAVSAVSAATKSYRHVQ